MGKIGMDGIDTRKRTMTMMEREIERKTEEESERWFRFEGKKKRCLEWIKLWFTCEYLQLQFMCALD